MFNGKADATVPAGAVLYSDGVNIAVPALGDVVVDLGLAGDHQHALAGHPAHGSVPDQLRLGERQPRRKGHVAWRNEESERNFFLSRLDVVNPEATGAVVAFGDSITDGTRSTPDTNNRWPNHLASRLAAAGMKVGVLNSGIAGNRVLLDGTGPNALSRFQLQALALSGVTHVVMLEGTNDFGQGRQNPTPTAEDIIAGHKQLIERAHAAGLKIYGATILPYYGAAYYTEVGEAKRQAINEWIRNGKAYDAVIDFDKTTRDPNDAEEDPRGVRLVRSSAPGRRGLQGDGRLHRFLALQTNSGDAQDVEQLEPIARAEAAES